MQSALDGNADKRGFIAKTKNWAISGASRAVDGAHSVRRAVVQKLDDMAGVRFLRWFPELKGEPLLWSASGKTISDGAAVKGELFVTRERLAFGGRLIIPKGKKKSHPVSMSVPFASLLAIQLAFAAWPGGRGTLRSGFAPIVSPLKVGQRMSTALLLFANDGSLHSLYGFKFLFDVLCVLDRQWRDVVDPDTLDRMPAPRDGPLPPGSLRTQVRMRAGALSGSGSVCGGVGIGDSSSMRELSTTTEANASVPLQQRQAVVAAELDDLLSELTVAPTAKAEEADEAEARSRRATAAELDDLLGELAE